MYGLSKRKLLLLSASLSCLLASPAWAADDAQIQSLQSQMKALQAQIDELKAQRQAPAVAAQSAPAAAPAPQVLGSNKPAIAYETPSHQFGLTSADGANSIEITGRIQFDVGAYPGYKAAEGVGPFGVGKGPQDGVNLRRGRVGVVGKFLDDFNYALIYDFGGSTDATPATGIENAFVTYNGWNKQANTVPVAVDFGYLDVPFTLDESVSSNDIMFMERSSAQAAAVSFGGSDARSAFGLRSYRPRYWLGAYVTGPTAGTAHTGQQNSAIAYIGRATYQVVQTDNASLHLGVNLDYSKPSKGNATAGTISLSDRPEFRIDSTTTLNTGTIQEKNASVVGAELAAGFQNFYTQAEFYHMTLSQWTNGTNSFGGANATSPDLTFDGGYLEASYSIGGRRKYNPSSGAYTGVIPDQPYSMSTGGMGAFEIAARFSALNLNDHLPAGGKTFASTGGIGGGDQKAYTFGVNWYANNNVRLMLDYVHADINQWDCPEPC